METVKENGNKLCTAQKEERFRKRLKEIRAIKKGVGLGGTRSEWGGEGEGRLDKRSERGWWVFDRG